MNKKASWIFVAIFLAYFVPFTSGFCYWASGCEETEKLITPYSLALSAKERGLAGITTKSDMDCIKWLLQESNPNFKMSGDLNTHLLFTGYFASYEIENTRFIELEKFYKTEHCYFLLTQQNIRNGVFILPSDIGLRFQYSFIINSSEITYEIWDTTTPNHRAVRTVAIHEVYRSGDSLVVEK